MKKLKTVGLILLFTVGFVFPSCEKFNGPKDSCDGVDFTQIQYFDIQGISLSNFSKGVEIIPFDTISFSELDFMYVDYETIYHANVQPQSELGFSLMGMSNACTVIPGTKGSKNESIENFSIITLNDFDDTHLANENINDLFDYIGSSFSTLPTEILLSQFLDEQTEKIMEEDMILKLKKVPELNQEFKVKVLLELSTGENYEFETEPIVITP